MSTTLFKQCFVMCWGSMLKETLGRYSMVRPNDHKITFNTSSAQHPKCESNSAKGERGGDGRQHLWHYPPSECVQWADTEILHVICTGNKTWQLNSHTAIVPSATVLNQWDQLIATLFCDCSWIYKSLFFWRLDLELNSTVHRNTVFGCSTDVPSEHMPERLWMTECRNCSALIQLSAHVPTLTFLVNIFNTCFRTPDERQSQLLMKQQGWKPQMQFLWLFHNKKV